MEGEFSMKIKKLLSLVLSIAVCMVLSVPCLAVADMEGPVTDRQGVLYVLTENVLCPLRTITAGTVWKNLSSHS